MTLKIHPKTYDENHVVISNAELEILIQALGESNQIEVELLDDINGENLMKICENSGSFDFLLDENENVYTLEDLKISYK